MPSSPRTPRHSRHMSNDMGFSQLHYSPSSSPIERRGSRSSLAGDPATPLRGHGYPGRGDSMDMSMTGGLPGSGMNQSNGLGNLADELEGAFSDSGDEYYEEEDGETEEEHDGVAPGISVQDMGAGDETSRHRRGADGGTRDSGVDVASPVAAGGGADAAPGGRQKSMSLSLPSANGGRSRGGGQGHRRTPSEYDGSEYGSESDLDSPGMLTPSLVARMDAIESLARRGADSSPSDGVFQRVTEGLRDLGSQSNVEGGTTRLITAHDAFTTQLTYKSKQLHTLAYSLAYPLPITLPPETVDELLPLVDALPSHMPRPTPQAAAQLAHLHAITADLAQSLSVLSDSLHMSRQGANTASRLLRTARDMVQDMRRDEERREETERWLVRGGWDDRLRRRECAAVCRDVVGGFEEVCRGWRERLLAQAGGVEV